MPEIQFDFFQRKYLRPYTEFAEESWGKSCYQSSEKYLNWLYKENPCGNSSEEDFILGLAEGKVVGCIHKMRWVWKNKDQIEFIPNIHNLMVSEKYRKGWFGIKLLKQSLLGENHALIPGVPKNQGSLYRFLKCQQVTSCWYRKILTPIKGALCLSLKKLLNYDAPNSFFTLSQFQNKKFQDDPVQVTLEPDELTIQKIVSQLNKKPSETLSAYWTLEQFKWRFFHPLGPKHLLIYKDSEHTLEDFLILSLGPRRGLNVARVVEFEASSSQVLKHLMQVAERVIKIFGGHVLLVFCASQRLNEKLQELNLKLIKNSPNTYFAHKNSDVLFHSVAFTGSAGDFGFEAIP